MAVLVIVLSSLVWQENYLLTFETPKIFWLLFRSSTLTTKDLQIPPSSMTQWPHVDIITFLVITHDLLHVNVLFLFWVNQVCILFMYLLNNGHHCIIQKLWTCFKRCRKKYFILIPFLIHCLHLPVTHYYLFLAYPPRVFLCVCKHIQNTHYDFCTFETNGPRICTLLLVFILNLSLSKKTLRVLLSFWKNIYSRHL